MEFDRVSLQSQSGVRLFERPGSDIRMTGYLKKLKVSGLSFDVCFHLGVATIIVGINSPFNVINECVFIPLGRLPCTDVDMAKCATVLLRAPRVKMIQALISLQLHQVYIILIVTQCWSWMHYNLYTHTHTHTPPNTHTKQQQQQPYRFMLLYQYILSG